MSENAQGPAADGTATEPQERVRLEEQTVFHLTTERDLLPCHERDYEAVRSASAAIPAAERPHAKDLVLKAGIERRARGAALAVLVAMLLRFNWATGELRHASRRRLAQATGYDIKGVDRGLEELRAKRIIIIRKVHSAESGWGQSTYVFPDMVPGTGGASASRGGGMGTARGGGAGAPRGDGSAARGMAEPAPLGGGGAHASNTLERTLDPTLEGHSPPTPRQGRGARERDRKADQVHLIERLCADRPDLAKVLREFCRPLIAMRRLESSDPAFAVIAIAEHAAQFPARVIAAAKNAILRERTDTFGEVHVSKALDAAMVASGGQRSPDRPAAPYTPAHGLIEIRQSTHPAEWVAWKRHAWHRRHGDTLHGKMERLGVAYVPSLMPPDAATRDEAS